MIHNHALIASFFRDAWFIDPAYADIMLPGVIEFIEGKNATPNLQTHEKQLPYCLDANLSSLQRRHLPGHVPHGRTSVSGAPSGSSTTQPRSDNNSGKTGTDSGKADIDSIHDVPGSGNVGTAQAAFSAGDDFDGSTGKLTAVLPIRGAITKYDGYCNHGVESYMQWMDDAESSDAVSEIILLIDSPGGQANSAFMLANRIAQATKPTLAYIDSGMAASAAYLIASAADKIFVNTPVDMIGSIGAMFNITDYSSQLQNTRTWEIYSRLSTEKNLGYRKLKQNNDTSILEDMLDENVEHFIETVKINRGDRLNLSVADPFKGATYTAATALKIGLIDGIGPLSTALSNLRSNKTTSTQPVLETAQWQQDSQVALEDNNPIETQTHTETMSKISFKQRLANWLADQDDAPEATAEQPTPEATTPEATTPEATGPTLEQRLAALETTLGSLKTENAQLTTENATLKSTKPAGEPTTPVVTNESIPQPVEAAAADVSSFMSETDVELAKLRGDK